MFSGACAAASQLDGSVPGLPADLVRKSALTLFGVPLLVLAGLCLLIPETGAQVQLAMVCAGMMPALALAGYSGRRLLESAVSGGLMQREHEAPVRWVPERTVVNRRSNEIS